GYPGDYPKAIPIDIPAELAADPAVVVFHAGTTLQDGRLVSNGGRILNVTATGATVAEAAERSRSAAAKIRIDGGHFRRDIGWREIARGASGPHPAR
ncbi:MAG: phosphoribosylamine--glycine ligase, partial [Gemmatimonadetes bacterium]|nr:phosphoribosylamine--glycine ligase [Gemmatimonadota bacterium]